MDGKLVVCVKSEHKVFVEKKPEFGIISVYVQTGFLTSNPMLI